MIDMDKTRVSWNRCEHLSPRQDISFQVRKGTIEAWSIIEAIGRWHAVISERNFIDSALRSAKGILSKDDCFLSLSAVLLSVFL